MDNTFTSPYLQRPHELGTDVVVHGATEYLGGHNDLIAGLVTVSRRDLGGQLYFYQNSTGSILGPQDSWLLLRGMKALAVRIQRQEENAQALARWLKNHPACGECVLLGPTRAPRPRAAPKPNQRFRGSSFLWPRESGAGLEGPAPGQATGAGTQPGWRGEHPFRSWPPCPMLLSHPISKKRPGIGDNLLRLSVGLEDPQGLIADLDQALAG